MVEAGDGACNVRELATPVVVRETGTPPGTRGADIISVSAPHHGELDNEHPIGNHD